jgi:ferredoxin
MRLSLNATRCEGFGYCENEAEDLVHLDEDGDLVVDVEELNDEQVARAEAAARVCPVAALKLVQE